jgi:protein-tyrosine-phosphatase
MDRIRKRVLFVCHSNVNRSVLAHFVFDDYAAMQGNAQIEVDSAGIVAEPDKNPDPQIVRLIKMRTGKDASGYQSKRLNPTLVKNADMIVAMDQGIETEIRSQYPTAQKRTHLIDEFGEYDGDHRTPTSNNLIFARLLHRVVALPERMAPEPIEPAGMNLPSTAHYERMPASPGENFISAGSSSPENRSPEIS